MHRRRRFDRRDAIWAAAVAFVAMLGSGAYAFAANTGPAYTHQCVIAETPKPGGGFTRTEDCDPLTPSTSPSATPSPSSSPTPAPTPSPSPTSTPTPSPSTSTTAPATTPPAPSPTGPLTNCLAAPARCGFPDALSTGSTSGLTVSTKTVYSTAGQVVVNTQINGCVEIRAAGVVFRNVLFTGACFWTVRVYSGSVTIQDSEISCARTAGSSGFVSYSGASVASTLQRVDIHDCENGLSVQGNLVVSDSWIHTLCCSGHSDGAQVDQGAANFTFSHNTIDNRGDTTSAIIMWTEGGTQNSNALITGNLLAGGAYTLYCPRSNATNVRVIGNRFGPSSFGPTDSCVPGHVAEFSGNVADATNAPLSPA